MPVYREGLVVDAAHREAVVSGVDGSCEHLVQVHASWHTLVSVQTLQRDGE